MSVDHSIKQAVIDTGATVGAFSMPLWIQRFEGWIQFGLYIGAALLLGFRFYIAWREHKKLKASDFLDDL